MRCCEIVFETKDCTWFSESPSGKLPCVDWEGNLLCLGDESWEDGRGADASIVRGVREGKAIIRKIGSRGYNLDGSLNGTEKGYSLAFMSLIEKSLLPALDYSLWSDKETYGTWTREAYSKGLQFPLTYILPYGEKRFINKGLQAIVDPSLVYQHACDAIHALGHLYDRSDSFVFSDVPSTLGMLDIIC